MHDVHVVLLLVRLWLCVQMSCLPGARRPDQLLRDRLLNRDRVNPLQALGEVIES
jgi:hypothetical protein